MKEDYYCPLLHEIIELGLCMDINFEGEKMAKLNTFLEFGLLKYFMLTELVSKMPKNDSNKLRPEINRIVDSPTRDEELEGVEIAE
ncbi:hypothetical protein J2Z69_001806 [Paenibacillus shirakamiensis]|uniref:Uncharacterized protein n=1 Tax=Paenibacillus shirakamiensis TaxID=1265935 RepID=A0ABS4JGC2_9BACL|nr:hypothetical protein [Paenibacillus shirakamiensis]MBP2000775.1 hypothetical protein [Paenibacillus shirakamiensis]